MNWLADWRLKRAARKYARTLQAYLQRHYGASETYTSGQIQTAVRQLKLDPTYICVGYAAFLSQTEYERISPGLPVRLSYEAAREVYGRYVPSKLFANAPPDGGDGSVTYPTGGGPD